MDVYVADWHSERGRRLVLVEHEKGAVKGKFTELGTARVYKIMMTVEGRYLTRVDEPTVESAQRRIATKLQLLEDLNTSVETDASDN